MLAIGSLVIISASLFAATQDTQPQTARIRGSIESLNERTIQLKSDDGQLVAIALHPDTRILASYKSELSDIKAGDFVGSAAHKGPDGRLRAEEVHIFSEELRGRGEGHSPMGPDANNTMTNGTVVKAAPQNRSMTNGTVSGISGRSSRYLTIEYNGGQQTIEVAPDTPIVTLVVADRTILKDGGRVSVVATQNDHGIVATSITVETGIPKPR